MAAATAQTPTLDRSRTPTPTPTPKPPRPKFVCFSFAAYAKTVIDHLKSLNIPVLPGLSDPEFNSIESAFNFSFPPDLRSILQEGLPIGPGFPNWRSSSFQQLHILLNLPRFSLLKEISQRNFWCQSWGTQPDDPNEAVALAKQFLDRVPILVPIYRSCYIPSMPNMAGNPVFYVSGGEIRVSSFDLAGFFQNHQYSQLGDSESSARESKQSRINSPAWAATEARTVDFWTEVSERRKWGTGRGTTQGWWNDGEFELGLDGCLEEVFWKLREGGWREEEVREMMMMMEGEDQTREETWPTIERGRVAEVLLGGGWSRDDVVYSLNLEDNCTIEIPEEESTFEINLQHPLRLSHVERSSIKQLMPHFLFAPHQNLIL